MNATCDIMSKEVVTINPSDSIINAYRLMKERDIRHLPVVDGGRNVVGMLSDRDIQKAMAIKKLDEYYNEAQIPEEYTVRHFMNWPVCVVSEQTSIKNVAEIMIREKISSLVVENDLGELGGIVTTTDLLAYILQNLEKPEPNNWTQWTLALYLKNKKKGP